MGLRLIYETERKGAELWPGILARDKSACVSAEDATKNITIASNTTGTKALATVPSTPTTWQAFVVQEPNHEKAKEGETVVLGCQFLSPQDPSLNELPVKWYRKDDKQHVDILENNVTLVANNARVSISGNLSIGCASLTIINVTVSDHGIYFCQVMLPSGAVVTGDGVSLRIRKEQEEALGTLTVVGVVAAVLGVLICLIIILTPRFRKHLPCLKQQA
ncbi:uncharacterized protein LOC115077035 isoform X2 [Rhinatrema bivittatum]|uniref:uncharacterized protein LOC115077035 isoform X2 n=1 Tax=Rhinatrema bivittatum TaxID=194408 RepID=UPI00112A7632|nr:uncharacterized protein LOC115077035 isoform X2 [Rhinatrema bivittatum]